MEDASKENLKELIIKSKAGDKEAYSRLYSDWFSKIFGFFYLRTGNSGISEDLCQLVFLKIWKNIKNVREPEVSVSWVFSIARNVLIDFWRKKKEISVGEWEDLEKFYEGEDTEYLADLKRKSKDISKAMMGLSEEQKEIISLKFFDELSNKEIEKITGKSQTAIRSIQYRAIVSLRKILKEDE